MGGPREHRITFGDTWLFDRIFNYAQFELGTPAADFEADIEPFLLFVSGPVPLAAGEASFFSTAWIFPWPVARSTACSDPTAPARPRPSAC